MHNTLLFYICSPCLSSFLCFSVFCLSLSLFLARTRSDRHQACGSRYVQSAVLRFCCCCCCFPFFSIVFSFLSFLLLFECQGFIIIINFLFRYDYLCSFLLLLMLRWRRMCLHLSFPLYDFTHSTLLHSVVLRLISLLSLVAGSYWLTKKKSGTALIEHALHLWHHLHPIVCFLFVLFNIEYKCVCASLSTRLVYCRIFLSWYSILLPIRKRFYHAFPVYVYSSGFFFLLVTCDCGSFASPFFLLLLLLLPLLLSC